MKDFMNGKGFFISRFDTVLGRYHFTLQWTEALQFYVKGSSYLQIIHDTDLLRKDIYIRYLYVNLNACSYPVHLMQWNEYNLHPCAL
jgi:hypothetical protein